jgi:hypothetical protein
VARVAVPLIEQLFAALGRRGLRTATIELLGANEEVPSSGGWSRSCFGRKRIASATLAPAPRTSTEGSTGIRRTVDKPLGHPEQSVASAR